MSNKNKIKKETALADPKAIAKANAKLLPALEEIENKVSKYVSSVEDMRKDTIRAIAIIDRDELYKARGYQTANKYFSDNHLAGLSPASCSQYLQIARKFVLTESKERAELFNALSFTKLAELVTYSDNGIKALCAENKTDNVDNVSIDNIRSFKNSHEVSKNGEAKQKILKSYDISGFIAELGENGTVTPFAKGNIPLSEFYTLYGIDSETVTKVKQVESGTKIKDSFLYTAFDTAITRVFSFTAILHLAKEEKVKSTYASTPEAKKAALIDYLSTLSPEEKAAFLSDIH